MVVLSCSRLEQLINLFLFIENIKNLHSHHLNTISAGFILYRFLVTDVIVRKIDAEKIVKVEQKEKSFLLFHKQIISIEMQKKVFDYF